MRYGARAARVWAAGRCAVVGAAPAALALALTGMWLACSAGTRSQDGSEELGLTGHGDSGRIEGRVTIGPLCPVERVPPDPSCAPTTQLLAALKVEIHGANGSLLRAVDLNDSGGYGIDVEPGTYFVDTSRHGFGLQGSGDSTAAGDSGGSIGAGGGHRAGAPGDATSGGRGDDGGAYRALPVLVEVRAGQTVRVDIDIDTGIR
jgi:hypothetical protein